MAGKVFTSWGSACNVERLLDETQPVVPSYKITQAPLMESWGLDSGENAPQFRKEINFGAGPFLVDTNIKTYGLKITGYLDTDREEVGITVSIMGISIGSYHFSLKEGLNLNFDLLLAKGSLGFYIKDKSLIMRASVKISFDGEYDKDYVIISW